MLGVIEFIVPAIPCGDGGTAVRAKVCGVYN